jgi:hypothetical protein
MLWYAVLYRAILCCAVLCCAVQYSAMLHHVLERNAMRHGMEKEDGVEQQCLREQQTRQKSESL